MNPHLQIVTSHPPFLVSTPLLTLLTKAICNLSHTSAKKKLNINSYIYNLCLFAAHTPFVAILQGICSNTTRISDTLVCFSQMPQFQNESIDFKIYLDDFAIVHFFNKTPSSLLMWTGFLSHDGVLSDRSTCSERIQDQESEGSNCSVSEMSSSSTSSPSHLTISLRLNSPLETEKREEGSDVSALQVDCQEEERDSRNTEWDYMYWRILSRQWRWTVTSDPPWASPWMATDIVTVSPVLLTRFAIRANVMVLCASNVDCIFDFASKKVSHRFCFDAGFLVDPVVRLLHQKDWTFQEILHFHCTNPYNQDLFWRWIVSWINSKLQGWASCLLRVRQRTLTQSEWIHRNIFSPLEWLSNGSLPTVSCLMTVVNSIACGDCIQRHRKFRPQQSWAAVSGTVVSEFTLDIGCSLGGLHFSCGQPNNLLSSVHPPGPAAWRWAWHPSRHAPFGRHPFESFRFLR